LHIRELLGDNSICSLSSDSEQLDALGKQCLLPSVAQPHSASFTNVLIVESFAGNEGDEGNDHYIVDKQTTVNSISCTANADAQAVSYARDAHVNAFAEAHKNACSDGKIKKSIVNVWESGVAKAVAKVSSRTFLKIARLSAA
jgi:hypothetical protein